MNNLKLTFRTIIVAFLNGYVILLHLHQN